MRTLPGAKTFAVEFSTSHKHNNTKKSLPTERNCTQPVEGGHRRSIPKITPTPSADKQRPVSLTPALAKVAESFVTDWILKVMTRHRGPREYGNLRGRSTSHYLVELVQYMN